MNQHIALTINQVKEQFEAWRSTRTGRRSIPEHLWQAAISLIGHYPISHICRELGINHQQLQKQQSNKIATHQQQKLSPAFFKLKGSDLNPTAIIDNSSKTNCQILLERVDGNRFTISLPLDTNNILRLCLGLLKENL